ncbi:villin-2-like isoform X2 [Fagus crenata]
MLNTVCSCLKQPGVALQHANEGKESQSFWRALGGKQSYTSKKVAQEIVRDPHLFKYSFNKGIIPPVEEVDDLFTEDILILNTHAEVFVWVGQSVESQRKKAAFKIGEKYIEMAASSEQFGLSSNVPLYTVFEGNEPCFFRTYFSWNMFGVPVKIDRTHNVHDDSNIIACCDGLVLVRNTNELFIWNMLIRRCWNISVSELPVKKLGDYSVRFYFGHDLTGDHKVLMEDLLSETFELKL